MCIRDRCSGTAERERRVFFTSGSAEEEEGEDFAAVHSEVSDVHGHASLRYTAATSAVGVGCHTKHSSGQHMFLVHCYLLLV